MSKKSCEIIGPVEVSDEVYDLLDSKASKEYIEFSLKDRKPKLLDNKIGGVPFIPQGGIYPISTVSGEKLHLVMQVNFETFPHLEDYPSKGILQLFLEAEDCYGLDADNPQEQSSWRIVYHEDISNPMPEEDVLKLMPEMPTMERLLPVQNVNGSIDRVKRGYLLTPRKEKMWITSSSFNFDDVYEEICNQVVEKFNLDASQWDEFFDSILEECREDFYGSGTRIGGYPAFTQYDCREGEFENYRLLLQIDSESLGGDNWAVIWGDCGIAQFLIDPEDLKKCDFSKVYYNWDCL